MKNLVLKFTVKTAMVFLCAIAISPSFVLAAQEQIKETCGNIYKNDIPAARVVGWKGDLLEVF